MYVILNTTVPTHFCLTGQASWSLLDLTLVSNSLASHCSSTVTNDLLSSDHSVIITEIKNCSPETALFRSTWNCTKANWPLSSEICDTTLTAFSVNFSHSYQPFETSILEAASLAIPKTKPWHKPSVLWWTNDRDIAIKHKKHAFLRMKPMRPTTDIIIFKRCRAKAWRIILDAK